MQFREWLDAALANVVEHAYPPDHPHLVMRLQAQLNHQVLITISDEGCWRACPPQATARTVWPCCGTSLPGSTCTPLPAAPPFTYAPLQ
ncbi:MAG: hypothetical protein LC799_21850 [Actinobacteria bacterium]|nr:hypothetical protein [Actinomycetota bacterium]